MRYFQISMSTKDKIVIDEDDFVKLENNMGTGNLVKLKKGIVNPSFIVSIYPITERDAMAAEIAAPSVEGYIDEETGVFKITKRQEVSIPKLTDEFKKS